MLNTLANRFRATPSFAQREQRSQVLLLIAIFLVVAEHLGHLPIWATLAFVGLWAWRLVLSLRLASAPSRYVTSILLFIALGGTWICFKSTPSKEASVTFLVLLIGLKTLEMRAMRDVFILTFLCIIAMQTQFLFQQNWLCVVLDLGVFALLLMALLGAHLQQDFPLALQLSWVLRLLIPTLALAVCLYQLVPLPQELPDWIPGQAHKAHTGLGSTMKPGDIGQLLNDDTPAMYVRFSGPIPDQQALYWRGPVLDTFDGSNWFASNTLHTQTLSQTDVVVQNDSVTDYTISLTPLGQRILPALGYAQTVDGVTTVDGRLNQELELRSATPVRSSRTYRIHSQLNVRVQPDAEQASLAPWLQLPEQTNPQTQAWAHQLLQTRLQKSHHDRANGANIRAQLVEDVFAFFRQAAFQYRLDPPQLNHTDRIDQFLFETRTGFCEHYASAFVFIMRSMGIPARIVTGYQGGYVAGPGQPMIVRQSDSHAWAEVWMEGQGWIRVDPTASIAPSRTASKNTLNPTNLANQIWAKLKQLGFALGFGGILSLAVGLAASAWAWVVRRQANRGQVDNGAHLLQNFHQRLRRAGITIPQHLGLQDSALYLQSRLTPTSAAYIGAWLHDMQAVRYAPNNPGAPDLKNLAMRLQAWQIQTVRGATTLSES